MNYLRRILFFVNMKALISIITSLSISCSSFALENHAHLDSVVSKYMQEYRIVGLSIGIVQDGEPIFARGFGHTSVDLKQVVQTNTSFHVASVTKLFTATAIMQLVEQGKLSLQGKLVDYLPEFEMKDERYKDITILHLLTHTSGIGWDNYLKDSPNDSTALKTFVYSLNKAKIFFNPGEKFGGDTYSNTGYDILGYVVEHVSGIRYVDYVEQNILGPIGMSSTTYNHKEISAIIKSQPHVLSGSSREIKRFNKYNIIKDVNPVLKYPENPIVEYNVYGDDSEHDPSANINSTTKDLSAFIIHLLGIGNNGNNSDQEILKKESLQFQWNQKSMSYKLSPQFWSK